MKGAIYKMHKEGEKCTFSIFWTSRKGILNKENEFDTSHKEILPSPTRFSIWQIFGKSFACSQLLSQNLTKMLQVLACDILFACREKLQTGEGAPKDLSCQNVLDNAFGIRCMTFADCRLLTVTSSSTAFPAQNNINLVAKILLDFLW